MTQACESLVDYVSPFQRDQAFCTEKSKKLVFSPWVVQNICYELLTNYMLVNDPKTQGYIFSQRYRRDARETEIFVDLGLNYRDDVLQKRPGIFVSRGPVQFVNPTFNQQVGGDSRDSKKHKLSIVRMPVQITYIATNVGFVEQLAEYGSHAFFSFAEQIRNDFFFRNFKLESLSQPALYLESKDHYAITANIATDFDMGFTITGDHLKLKTVSFAIFNDCVDKPLTLQ
jgi:hypothetical protein